MKQKRFMDIENLRINCDNGVGFEVGDIIQITEKYDGSNACATFDAETNSMVAFSRKQHLKYNNTLNGFYNYVMSFDETTIQAFKNHLNYRVFGEWNNKNKIMYNDTNKIRHWYVYDIYDTDTECWLHQDIVKDFCNQANLEYINELYYGEFISWEHCRQFGHCNTYGNTQEGVVIKNMTKLNSEYNKLPFYIKIVNDDFRESQKIRKLKVIDPQVEQAQQEVLAIAQSIVTFNRVEKELYKLRDEQLVPDPITPQDMKLIAKILPQRIYEDCLKEEKDLVLQCGEYFGKHCNSLTMQHARKIILG